MDKKDISRFAWWFFKEGTEKATERLEQQSNIEEDAAHEIQEELLRHHQVWNLIGEGKELDETINEDWMLDAIASLIVENSVNCAIVKLGGGFGKGMGFDKKLDQLFTKAEKQGVEIEEGYWKRKLKEKYAGRHLPVHELPNSSSTADSAQESYETALDWLRELKEAGLTPPTTDVQISREKWRPLTGDWELEEELLRQTEEDTEKVIVAEDTQVKNGSFNAKINAVNGKSGQHLIWRGDGNARSNYYVFGSGGLENEVHEHVHWGYFDGGNGFEEQGRKEPHEYGVNLERDNFHEYEVEFQDHQFIAYIDGEQMFEVRDDTHGFGGCVGFHCGNLTTFRDIQLENMD